MAASYDARPQANLTVKARRSELRYATDQIPILAHRQSVARGGAGLCGAKPVTTAETKSSMGILVFMASSLDRWD